MRRIYKHHATILAALALVVALVGVPGVTAGGILVTSKQIKNGSILTQDIHKAAVKSSDLGTNAVQSPDIKTGAVQSADIGAGEVEPQDVTMPDPVQLVVSDTNSMEVSSNDFVLLDEIGTYTKQDPTSTLQVDWTGTVGSTFGTGCTFQLRVDKQPSANGGGMTYLQSGPEAATAAAVALFNGLPAGPHSVELWVKQSPASAGTTRCILAPAAAGIPQTFVVGEQVV